MTDSRHNSPTAPFASIIVMLAILLTAMVRMAQAQTPIDVYNFGSVTGDAANPGSPSYLVQGRDGNMYGTTGTGGTSNEGAIFMVTPSGTETVLHSFQGADGTACTSGLTLGYDGNFYGACAAGGASNMGVVYKITPTGAFTLLHSFTGNPDGEGPFSPPIQTTNGDLYGTTQFGGKFNNGAIYKLTPTGTLTILHSIAASGEGLIPDAPLLQASDGNLYGSTVENNGEIFKISTAGKLKVIHTFTGTDGASPTSALIQGTDGRLYGVTEAGGTNGQGVVFKMTTAGAITVLHSFSQTTDGAGPQASLVQATDGNLYSVLPFGGSNSKGTLYKLTTAGTFSVLFSFNGTLGATPAAALAQNTNGLLYGDTQGGGPTNQGLFVSSNIGASPFCSLQITSGAIGASTNIFGQGFSTGSVVSFGGVHASSTTLTGTTFIAATVPPAALTGSVTVKTGSTTLTCKQTFKVVPTLKTFSPASGPVGTEVTITGTGLTQASKVTFNGTVATFTVNSDTQITASVPAGATTGKISVTTKGGTVSSSAKFTVN